MHFLTLPRAIALAARLKAMGVDSIMAEKNAAVGDNWALRYDAMKFHVPTSFCELPFMSKFCPREAESHDCFVGSICG
jgi:cation diffusion facilitator CzcD-associated flavoprotein CzcO